MALELWTPINERPRYSCRICGSMMLSRNSYEGHVVKCAKQHYQEIERYRELKRENVFFRSADPEYREWQKKTGKLY